jgi:glycosyltransferase involved in cell wall biosynthesis
VEVWTTTIREFASNWNTAFHPEGTEVLNGVLVRRFRSDFTNHELFNRINERILSGERISDAEERLFFSHSATSWKLCRALAREPKRLTIVIPYCFGLSVDAARVNPNVTFMIPCFHDEGYARFTTYTKLFREIRGLIVHAAAERRLIRNLHDAPEEKLYLLGEGVDTELRPDPDRFRRLYVPDGRFILAVGRKDATKNTPELLKYFGLYRERFPGSPLRLVLVGAGEADVPPSLQPWVVDLGFLPREDVVDALGAAEALVQPSLNESFSLVLMEAWICGTPVLVNGHCEVTREFTEAAGGGWSYSDYPDFERGLRLLEEDPVSGRARAERGRAFVLERFTWPAVAEGYERLALEVEGAGAAP